MSDTEVLLAHIQAADEGISLAELLRAYPDVSRRTAQRHIADWLAQGGIRAQGQGRARRYFPALVAPSGADSTGELPLSAAGREIRRYIQQPARQRQPVGYQTDFLRDYVPNVSAWLSQPLRRQLHAMGQAAPTQAPAGTYSRAILNRLLIDLSWASSHLEGNTYSRLDTRQLIETGQASRGKAAFETQMILNHKTAIELLAENIERADFDRTTLFNIHAALAENLLANPMDEGRIRQHAVDIAGSVYRPLSVPQALHEQLTLFLDKAAAIDDPFEQSFFVMVYLPYLQPFADINKRTSRLMANLPLFRSNLCPLTFIDVPEADYTAATLGVYEMTRIEWLRDLYVWAYERSVREYLALRQNLAEPDPLRLTWRGLIKQLVRDAVQQPEADPVRLVRQGVQAVVPQADQFDVTALIQDELKRLHEGVLARYGLRPSEYRHWRDQQDR